MGAAAGAAGLHGVEVMGVTAEELELQEEVGEYDVFLFQCVFIYFIVVLFLLSCYWVVVVLFLYCHIVSVELLLYCL